MTALLYLFFVSEECAQYTVKSIKSVLSEKIHANMLIHTEARELKFS